MDIRGKPRDRNGTTVNGAGTAFYWSSSPMYPGAGIVYGLFFESGGLSPTGIGGLSRWYSVRLVRPAE